MNNYHREKNNYDTHAVFTYFTKYVRREIFNLEPNWMVRFLKRVRGFHTIWRRSLEQTYPQISGDAKLKCTFQTFEQK